MRQRQRGELATWRRRVEQCVEDVYYTVGEMESGTGKVWTPEVMCYELTTKTCIVKYT